MQQSSEWNKWKNKNHPHSAPAIRCSSVAVAARCSLLISTSTAAVAAAAEVVNRNFHFQFVCRVLRGGKHIAPPCSRVVVYHSSARLVCRLKNRYLGMHSGIWNETKCHFNVNGCFILARCCRSLFIFRRRRRWRRIGFENNPSDRTLFFFFSRGEWRGDGERLSQPLIKYSSRGKLVPSMEPTAPHDNHSRRRHSFECPEWINGQTESARGDKNKSLPKGSLAGAHLAREEPFSVNILMVVQAILIKDTAARHKLACLYKDRTG